MSCDVDEGFLAWRGLRGEEHSKNIWCQGYAVVRWSWERDVILQVAFVLLYIKRLSLNANLFNCKTFLENLIMLAGKVLAWRCTVLVPRKMSWSFYLNLGVLEFVSINLRICCPSVLHAIIWFLQGKYFASKLILTSIPFERNNLKDNKCRDLLSSW